MVSDRALLLHFARNGGADPLVIAELVLIVYGNDVHAVGARAAHRAGDQAGGLAH